MLSFDKSFAIKVLFFVVVFIVIAACVSFCSGCSPQSYVIENIDIPDVHGETLADAVKALNACSVEVLGYLAADEKEAGTVIGTSFITRMGQGPLQIKLIVSTGPQTF